MKRSGPAPAGESASHLISQRITELGDWRGKTPGRIRALLKPLIRAAVALNASGKQAAPRQRAERGRR